MGRGSFSFAAEMAGLILAGGIAIQSEALAQVQTGELFSKEPIHGGLQLRRSRSNALATIFRECCRIGLDQVIHRDGRYSKTFSQEFRMGGLAAAGRTNQQDKCRLSAVCD